MCSDPLYMLQEYTDIFVGIGTMSGGKCHKEFKEDYKAVKHTPHSVPTPMKVVWRSE